MAMVGGATSEITGGKFANGAVTGAFVHLFNAENLNPYKQKLIKATKSNWISGKNGRYRVLMVDGMQTNIVSDFEYYNGRSPGEKFFNGLGNGVVNGVHFLKNHPDGLGLALSVGAVVTTGGTSIVFGISALSIDIYQPDYGGVFFGSVALLSSRILPLVADIGYGTLQAIGDN